MLETPAFHLGVVLRECRIRGYEFQEAWDMGLRSLPRGHTRQEREYLAEWKVALRWAKENFHAAYEGRTFRRAVGWDDDAVHEFRSLEPTLSAWLGEQSLVEAPSG